MRPNELPGKWATQWIILLYTVSLMVTLISKPLYAATLAGTWDLKSAGSVMFRFIIENKGDQWDGKWCKPSYFETDGEGFFNIKGEQECRKVSTITGDATTLSLLFEDPIPSNSPDKFLIRLENIDGAELVYTETPFEPFHVTRSSPTNKIGPWQSDHNYPLAHSYSSSAEMRSIFEADQSDRIAAVVDWSVVSASDRKRRTITEELLKANKLHSGTDFYEAAFVLQHGDNADDFLKAHLLAMLALARGRTDAIWISGATLDRYLQSTERPQVLGTQFSIRNGGETQEPYASSLISDSLRKAFHVPSVAEQELQRQNYEKKSRRQ